MMITAKVRDLGAIEADIAHAKEALSQVRGTETEVYARIVGYYRSVRNWNKGKREEYNHRKQFV
ncbi:MAG TPA: anaerobic ribonucleoside-triphosphate reductase, partial [Treponemataceae bacterium]|nr:anaerobic ribonucleoside-triphosphate reductase [Treponemataceae bacterium]